MIDLEEILGKEGLFTLTDGRQGHTHVIKERDGGYWLRVESGWYWEYERYGKRLAAGVISNTRTGESHVANPPGGDIISFRECRYEDGMGVFRP